MLKNLILLIFCNAALLLLVGCSMDSKEETGAANNDTTIGVNADEIKEDTINNPNSLEESNNRDEGKLNTDKDLAEEEIKSSPDSKVNEVNELSKYSSQQIEYARVWLQLGPNQEIDELYVKEIPKGTALNPDDEDMNVNYPEDVVQLTGSRLVDGSVTYSSNGDGTINVYNVPLRWYGGFPPPEDIDKEKVRQQMEDIIKNTKKVYIDPNNEEKIIEVIKKIKTN